MNASMSDRVDSYVYALVVDGVVRYIGKGSGVPMKRAKEHMRTARRALARRASGEKVWLAVYADHQLAKAITAGSQIEAVLIKGELSHVEAFKAEIELIAQHPLKQLWNRSYGGLGAGDVSEETRRRLSEATKRRLQSPEARESLRKWYWARSPESRERMIAASIAARCPSYRQRISQAAKARWQDPEKAKRMRAGLDKGRHAASEGRAKKRWLDPEARAKQREAMKRRWADPEFRQRQQEMHRRWTSSDAGKASIAKALSVRWNKENKVPA